MFTLIKLMIGLMIYPLKLIIWFIKIMLIPIEMILSFLGIGKK